ncbi:MAG: Inner membrane protein YbjJ [Anaerolineae bacterium]|nr:Inner membrane protein YbjJ [Anaerolineae bacterium]
MNSQTPSIQTARWAVLAMFFINGALFANWVARIPQIQAKLALSEGELGLVLLGIAVGVLVALSLAGGLIARYGSRAVTTAGALLLCLLLPPLALMPNAVTLWLNLFVFGAAMSTMDVAMNAQGVDVERRLGQAVMSSFHAAFSIGGFVGAGIGAAMATFSIGPLLHFATVAIGFLALTGLLSRWLLPRESDPHTDGPGAVFQLPPRILWPLGAVAFCAAIGEGSMADWSGVYLKSVVGTGAGAAAFGFAAFSLTMTLGRLLGDNLTMRFEPARLVQSGGILAAVGLTLAIIQPQLVPSLLGFAAVGAGMSIVVPLAFSAAGNIPGLPSGVGIAGVATIGYAGFLAGPPLIGLVAELTSLRVALLLVVALTGSLMFTSQALRAQRTRPAPVLAAGD